MTALAVAETYDTNAQLPEDKPVWPMSKVELSPDTISIETTFVSQKKIVSYHQGNWQRDLYLVTYQLKSVDEKFPNGHITFIAKDFSPAPGSGIQMKKLQWPFVPGDKTFLLDKAEDVAFRDYYNIVSYTP